MADDFDDVVRKKFAGGSLGSTPPGSPSSGRKAPRKIPEALPLPPGGENKRQVLDLFEQLKPMIDRYIEQRVEERLREELAKLQQ